MQLYGMSTHGLAWYPQYVNPDTFAFLSQKWYNNCIRLAMYTDEYGGYASGGDKEALKKLIRQGVAYATDLGMYVIIDWHVLNDQNPLVHLAEAKEFFAEMTAEFAGQDNILYEICNEPNSSATWADVSAYAKEIIPIIRGNDPDAVILVGTPTWSQDLEAALAEPLPYDNIMYTLHFYAATHKEDLRQRVVACMEAGLPVFISEFGLCDASGNGAVDEQEALAWKDMIESYGISFLCWNLSNKDEASAVFLPSCEKLTDFTEEDLSTQGRWMAVWFSEHAK